MSRAEDLRERRHSAQQRVGHVSSGGRSQPQDAPRRSVEPRHTLKQQVAQSVFDPKPADAERRKRQQEALRLLRGFLANKTPPTEARAALHDYIQRIAEPPPGPWRDQQRALLQEGCRNTAAMHNGTSASQRAQAVRRLQAYQDDLRQLVAAR